VTGVQTCALPILRVLNPQTLLSFLLPIRILTIVAILPFTCLRGSRAFVTVWPTKLKANRFSYCPSFPSSLSTRSTLATIARMSSKSIPLLSFNDFLAATPKSSITIPNNTTFIVGNQAGDADSIISALALAYVDYLKQPNEPHKVPIVSIPRADLVLRRDTVLLLSLANIDPTNLLYTDDVAALMATVQDPQLILVDHNRLLHTEFNNNNNKSPIIIEIVDHHYDEGHYQNATVRNICFDDTAVASTCTLIAERLFVHTPNNKMTTILTDLAIALLGVLVLDTVHSSPVAGKVTPRDTIVMEQLITHTDWSLLSNTSLLQNDGTTSTINTTLLFNYLSNAKFDSDFWKSLSVTDTLRLDFKRFEMNSTTGTMDAFGVSSVLLPMKEFLKKDACMEELQHYLTAHQLPILLVMSMHVVDGKPERDILICGNTTAWVTDLENFMLSNDSLEATKMEMKNDENDGVSVTWLAQGNARASRKQVAPMVLDFFNQQQESF